MKSVRLVHACYGPEGVKEGAGLEFDCPRCRASLLEAFRPPAEDPPVTGPVHHRTDVKVLVPPGATPSWLVRCSCGYRKYGTAQGEEHAVRMTAEAWAYRHRTDPEGAPE